MEAAGYPAHVKVECTDCHQVVPLQNVRAERLVRGHPDAVVANGVLGHMLVDEAASMKDRDMMLGTALD
jgi:hypothetical protein